MVKQFIKDLWLNWRRLENLPITAPHPQDQPKPALKAKIPLRHPAVGGDVSGSDHHNSETHPRSVPPADPTITSPHPQDQPDARLETNEHVHRLAEAGDTSGSDHITAENHLICVPPAGHRKGRLTCRENGKKGFA